MQKKLVILGSLILSGTLIAQPELKGSPEELKKFLHPRENIVTIEGTAKQTAYSDKAIVNLVIKTKKKLLADAIEKNSTFRLLVIKNLTSSGVKKVDINSSKFSTSPQFGWFGKTPDSFEVVNRMAISISDEEHLKLIAELADKNKEIELSSTSYEHTEKKAFEMKVKENALAEIMKQKMMYERILGVKLKPIGIQDSRISHRPTFASQNFEEKIVIVGSRIQRKESSISKPKMQQNSVRTFDEVEYSATLWVQFKVIEEN